MPALGISLNLSCNQFSGEIPFEFTGLTKLTILDISYNKLVGNVSSLAGLQNLVVLNISYNDLSGELPDTPFFRRFPLNDVTGNQALSISSGSVGPRKTVHHKSTLKVAMSLLISLSAVLLIVALYVLVRLHIGMKDHIDDNRWEMMLYQKLDFSTDDIVHHLTSSNVIGTGSSGVVYRIPIPNGSSLAVKKMWSSEELGAFESEIQTLGSIRHKNIVRLLGWCSNQNMKLLLYDYLSNGSLSSLLHGGGKGSAEWETRYDIVLGVAHALAYLHHDCVPPILHGDVKAMNVLLGPMFEPYLADFGLARLIINKGDACDESYKMNPKPQLAGSFGYMAPEHASTQRITEKSDVYSFGIMLLEVLTGKHPLDPTLSGGAHLVQWAREHLHLGKDPVDILDTKLQGRPDNDVHEMLQTLAVSFLCIGPKVDDRPMMKDVVAMLMEIRPITRSDTDQMCKGSGRITVSSLRISQSMVMQGSSSNCSFAFSDDSI